MSSPNVFYGPLKDEIERPPDSDTETEVEDTPKKYKRLRREREPEDSDPTVSVDVLSRAGQRELVSRASKGDLQYVGSGLQLGWVPNGEAVVGAARGGHTEVLGMLLAFVPGNVSFGGITPLAGAIMGGSLGAVELLLEKQMSFSWRDPQGQSYRDLANSSTPEIKDVIFKLYEKRKERRERHNSKSEPKDTELREPPRAKLKEKKEHRRDSLPKESRRESLPKAPAARPEPSLIRRRESEKEKEREKPSAPAVPAPAPVAAPAAPKKFSLMDYKNLRFKKPKKEAEEAERKKRELEEAERREREEKERLEQERLERERLERERLEQERMEQERLKQERLEKERLEQEREREREEKAKLEREKQEREMANAQREREKREAKERQDQESQERLKKQLAQEQAAKDLQRQELEAREAESQRKAEQEAQQERDRLAAASAAATSAAPQSPADVDMDATITLSAQEIEEQARANPQKLSARDSVPQYILKNETAVESPSSVDSPIESPRNPMQELLQKRERERRHREVQMLQRLEQQEKLQRPDRAASESPVPMAKPVDISGLPTILKQLACTGKPQDVGPLFAHRSGHGALTDLSKLLVLDVQVGALFGVNVHQSHPNLHKVPVSKREKTALWEFCRDWTEDSEHEKTLFCQFSMFWLRANEVKEALGEFQVIPVVLNAPDLVPADQTFAELAETLPVHLVQRIAQRQQVWGWD